MGAAAWTFDTYKVISTRPCNHEDARNVVRRQGHALDDRYVLHWLRQFEIALG
ncbi:MAG: hypothetical protein ACUVSU_16915 [Aggregatilineaceae bacterium]